MLGTIICGLKRKFLTTTEGAISPGEFALLFVADDIGLSAADIGDEAIDERKNAIIWRSIPGLASRNPGALEADATLYASLSRALQEKRVRVALKDLVPDRKYASRFPIMQQHARDLADGISPPIPQPILISGRANASPAVPALPLLVRACPSLRRFEHEAITCSIEKVPEALTFYDVLNMLQDPFGNFSAALRGIARSPAKVAIIILQRAIAAGRLHVYPALKAQIYLAAIPLITNYNATEAAHRLALEVLNSPIHDQLDDGGKVGFALGLAHTKQRSGRSNEAAAIHHQLMMDYPGRPDLVIRFIMSIHASRPAEALALAAAMIDGERPTTSGERIFLAELCLKAGDLARARQALGGVVTGAKLAEEGWLGFANISHHAGQRSKWFEYIQRFGDKSGFEVRSFVDGDRPAPFRFQTEDYPRTPDHPQIAVVMTSFNAAATIEHAALSVLSQTLANLELWIVDDHSVDGTRSILDDLAKRDGRVRILSNDRNCGTYVSKNRALRQTNADYVTFHDSDDWKHPRQLEVQLAALSKGAACSTSKWLRMDAGGEIQVRGESGYSHLNPASTLMPRSLLDQVGFFDEVRTGADAEFITRLRSHAGASSVVSTDQCLALGLHHDASLTTSGATAFDAHRFSPVRLAYTEAWIEWHFSQIENDMPLFLEGRPFDVPLAIRTSRNPDRDADLARCVVPTVGLEPTTY